MKKVLSVFVIGLFSCCLFGEWVNLQNDQAQDLIEFIQPDRGSIELEFNLNGYQSADIELPQGKFTKISYPQEGKILATGMPDLPVFTRLIAIPCEGTTEIKITDTQSHLIKNITIYPQEEIFSETASEQSVFSINEDYYLSGGIYPENIVEAGEPAIMRDLRVISLSFYPFRYHAQNRELTVFDQIKVQISTSGQGGINPKSTSRDYSRGFTGLYSSSVLNYSSQNDLRIEFQRPAILIIYPQNNTIENYLQYLINWKEKKGFEVSSAHTGQTGTSSASIKNYIQNAYDNWENPPEYVILVGDVNGSYYLPSWYETWSGGNGIGDHPYSQLEGDDVLADIMVGRLSFNNFSELQTIITKIINYESNPYIYDQTWFENAVMFAYGGPAKIATCETVEEYITLHNPNFTFDEIYYSNWIYSLDQALNAGASHFCWRSQGVDAGWNGDNINNLNNGWMLPFGILSTCYTADFGGNCLGEIFLKAGTSTVPKGGIAAIGISTGLTSGCFNNCLSVGAFYGIFIDEIYTCGSALLRGKLNLFQQYPNNPDNHVDCWSHCNTLFGDPSLELWTGVPEPVTVTYENEVCAGTNYMEIYIADQNAVPLDNAWITARGDDYFCSGYSDEQGVFFLDLNGVQLDNEYELTITSHNKIPFESEFVVIQPEHNPEIEEIGYIDTSGDGIPNPGENIDLAITLMNHGNAEIIELQAELVSCSDQVLISNAVTQIGNITAGGQVINSDLSLYIDPSVCGGTRLELELRLNSGNEEWNLPVFIDVSGVYIAITEWAVVSGNLILPGEDHNLYFTIENSGEIIAEDISGTLSCNDYNISVIDSLGYFGDIEPGSSADNEADTFLISVNENVIPGTQIPCILNITDNNDLNIFLQHHLEIGHLNRYDPLGPDEYGYYCYDDEDTAYDDCPVYDWIEILTIGENLNIFSMGDEALLADVVLPDDFTFVFYGIEYDLITVSTSGWICPGGTDAADFMNWIIPGPGGPSPMIAAFWDDLHNSAYGDVFTYYDEDEHLFIIEWYEMENENNNQDESFEIILYDPVYYATTTGDSKIKIQYREFDNANVGQYPYHGADHGLYCTVGIEDHTATRGLQYTYNNEYSPWVKPLTDATAILFTVSSVPASEPYISITEYQILSGDDEYVESGEEFFIDLALTNIGYQTAGNIEVEVFCSDSYINIVSGSASAGEIAPGEVSALDEPLILAASENIPDFHEFFINIAIVSDQDSWNYYHQITAYHPNTLALDQSSIDYEIVWGEQAVTSFELSNIGDIPVFYFMAINETEAGRNIAGSELVCNTESFIPGENVTWTFTLSNNSIDNEWISDVWIDFPEGVFVEDASSFVGGSGGDMLWDETTGGSALVNWHGSTTNDWGVLQGGECAQAAVNVNLSNQLVNDLIIDYTIGGDGYGDEPHIVEGEIILEYPLRWISLDAAYGTLEPDETDEIEIYLDSSEIPETAHSCNIIITTYSWDTKILPVTLTPVNNDDIPDQIPTRTILQQNYPNPFNPQTAISYSLAKAADNVSLKVYNTKGQLIKTLVNKPQSAGKYQKIWEGADQSGNPAASGVYLYKLSVDKNSYTRKMLLIK